MLTGVCVVTLTRIRRAEAKNYDTSGGSVDPPLDTIEDRTGRTVFSRNFLAIVGGSTHPYRGSTGPDPKNTKLFGDRRCPARDVNEDRGGQTSKTRAFCPSSGAYSAALSKIGASRVQKHECFAPPAGPTVQRYRRSGAPGSKNSDVLPIQRGLHCSVIDDRGL